MGYKRSYKLIKDWAYVGRGINLRKSPLEEVDVYLTMRNTHVLGLGRTRWGKTQMIKRWVVDDVERGLSVVVIDPKGDYELLEATVDAVVQTGREEDFIMFNLVYPEISCRLNPFSGLSPEAIGSMMKSLAPTDDEFFGKVCYYVGSSVAYALKSLGREELRPYDFYRFVSLEAVKELLEEVKAKGKDTTYLKDAILSLETLSKRDPTHFSKVSMDLEMMLHQLSTGKVGELFGRAKGNPLRKRLLERKPVVFYAYLGALSPETGEDVVAVTSRLISSCLEKIYGHYYDMAWSFSPPIAEYVDEAKQVFYQGMENKLAIAGGLNVYLHFFSQSEQDLVAKVGELAGTFFDNTNWIIFSIRDDRVAKKFEQGSGTKERYKPIWNRDDFQLVREREPLIPADHFKRTRKGVVHADIEGSWYRLYSPMIEGVRKLALTGVPYPDHRIQSALGVSSEEAVRLQFDYETLKERGVVDEVVDLRSFPYMREVVEEKPQEVSEEKSEERREERKEERKEEDRLRKALSKVEKWNEVEDPVFGKFTAFKKGNVVYVERRLAEKLGIAEEGTKKRIVFHVKDEKGRELSHTKFVYSFVVPDLNLPDAQIKPLTFASRMWYNYTTTTEGGRAMGYMEAFVVAGWDKDFYGELFKEYEKQNEELTRIAREENPKVVKVEPVIYEFPFVGELECLLVYTEGQTQPYIYVVYCNGEAEESFLEEEGRVIDEFEEENLPLEWETAKYLYERANRHLHRYLSPEVLSLRQGGLSGRSEEGDGGKGIRKLRIPRKHFKSPQFAHGRGGSLQSSERRP